MTEKPVETQPAWKTRLYRIIFEADTPAGKLFDVILIILIILSTLSVMAESVQQIRTRYGEAIRVLEWVFTILFTIEYILRLICVRVPKGYALSFFGIVDLMGILPTYLSLFLPGTQYLQTVRLLRVIRVFRVLKLTTYVGEAAVLASALRASGRKIMVFLFIVMILVVVLGSVMYFIEGPQNGFSSIPRGVYWCVVTLTTVGYGDISPHTAIGQAVASLIMILGYGIIAVPTGIVTVELAGIERQRHTRTCPTCTLEGHEANARYCKGCGAPLH